MPSSPANAGSRSKPSPIPCASTPATASSSPAACPSPSPPISPSPPSTSVSFSKPTSRNAAPFNEAAEHSIAGGHFLLTGTHADILLHSLPPIVHIRKESDKAAMRWSLERMKEELRDPQPGGSLIAQQLAYMMLIQALRLHLADAAKGSVGWLFALADKQMSAAITSMHDNPGHPWTLQSLAERACMSRSVFALRFKETVGTTPMEYLTRWRMLLAADRLQHSADSLSTIASSLGYESESAFGKAFRRIMGCSPRQYGRRSTSPLASSVEPAAPSHPARTRVDNLPRTSLNHSLSAACPPRIAPGPLRGPAHPPRSSPTRPAPSPPQKNSSSQIQEAV